MTITTEELRSLRATSNARWAGRGKSARMLVEAFSVDKIAAELITARAKLEAAEKLAEAARYFYEYGEKDRDLLSAIRAWEAVK